jgi:YggT family protein
VSKSLVKFTNPLLVPLRKIIPGLWGIDWAAIVLAIALQALLLQIIFLLAGFGIVNPAMLVAWAMVSLIGMLLTFYYWGVIVMIIASFVAPHSQNPALSLLNQVIAPVMAPFRKILPPIGVLDLSPMLFFMVLQILSKYAMPILAQLVGMPSGFGLGL